MYIDRKNIMTKVLRIITKFSGDKVFRYFFLFCSNTCDVMASLL